MNFELHSTLNSPIHRILNPLSQSTNWFIYFRHKLLFVNGFYHLNHTILTTTGAWRYAWIIFGMKLGFIWKLNEPSRPAVASNFCSYVYWTVFFLDSPKIQVFFFLLVFVPMEHPTQLERVGWSSFRKQFVDNNYHIIYSFRHHQFYDMESTYAFELGHNMDLIIWSFARTSKFDSQ